MAERTLRIPLAELATVRLVCLRQDCGGVSEFPSHRLSGLAGGAILCPSCNHPLAIPTFPGSQMSALRVLGTALNTLGLPPLVAAPAVGGAAVGAVGGPAQPTYRIEFVIPNPGE